MVVLISEGGHDGLVNLAHHGSIGSVVSTQSEEVSIPRSRGSKGRNSRPLPTPDGPQYELGAAAQNALTSTFDPNDPQSVRLHFISQQREVLRGFKRAWERTVEAESIALKHLLQHADEAEFIEQRGLAREKYANQFTRKQTQQVAVIQLWWKDVKAGRVGKRALRASLFTLRFRIARTKVLKIRSIRTAAAMELEEATEEDRVRMLAKQHVEFEHAYQQRREEISSEENSVRGKYKKKLCGLVKCTEVRQGIADLYQTERHRRGVVVREWEMEHKILARPIPAPPGHRAGNRQGSAPSRRSFMQTPIQQARPNTAVARPPPPQNRSMALASLLSCDSGSLSCSSFQVAALYGKASIPPAPVTQQVLETLHITQASPTDQMLLPSPRLLPISLSSQLTRSTRGSSLCASDEGDSGAREDDIGQEHSFYGEPVRFSARRSMGEFPFQGYDDRSEVEPQYGSLGTRRKTPEPVLVDDSDGEERNDSDRDVDDMVPDATFERERIRYSQGLSRRESQTSEEAEFIISPRFSATMAARRLEEDPATPTLPIVDYTPQPALEHPESAQPSWCWNQQRPRSGRSETLVMVHARVKKRESAAVHSHEAVRSATARMQTSLSRLCGGATQRRSADGGKRQKGLNDTYAPGPSDPCAIVAASEVLAPHHSHFYFGTTNQSPNVVKRLENKRRKRTQLQEDHHPASTARIPTPPSVVNYRYPAKSALTYSPEAAPPSTLDPTNLLQQASAQRTALLNEHSITVQGIALFALHERSALQCRHMAGTELSEISQRSFLIVEEDRQYGAMTHLARNAALQNDEFTERQILYNTGLTSLTELCFVGSNAGQALIWEGLVNTLNADETDARDDITFAESSAYEFSMTALHRTAVKLLFKIEAQQRVLLLDEQLCCRRKHATTFTTLPIPASLPVEEETPHMVPHSMQRRVFCNREADRREIASFAEQHRFDIIIAEWHEAVDGALENSVEELELEERGVRASIGGEEVSDWEVLCGAEGAERAVVLAVLAEALEKAVTQLETAEANARGSIKYDEDTEVWFTHDLLTSPGLLDNNKIVSCIVREESGSRLALEQHQCYEYTRWLEDLKEKK